MIDIEEVGTCGARGEKDPCKNPCAYITNVPILNFDFSIQPPLFQFMCNMKDAKKERWRSMRQMQSSSPKGNLH
jgi:hypothetical protein